MYLHEVTHCKTCLLAASVLVKGRGVIAACLGTRTAITLPAPKLPTQLPDLQMPQILQPGQELPEPPDWCPLRKMPIVISYGKGSADGIGYRDENKNLWPDDIGKEPEE